MASNAACVRTARQRTKSGRPTDALRQKPANSAVWMADAVARGPARGSRIRQNEALPPTSSISSPLSRPKNFPECRASPNRRIVLEFQCIGSLTRATGVHKRRITGGCLGKSHQTPIGVSVWSCMPGKMWGSLVRPFTTGLYANVPHQN